MSARTVTPIVRRHAEDSAFYWQQLDSSLTEPGLRAQRAWHFARLLDAHLEGLQAAGADGLPPALEALERWRKPGEAFVAAWVSLGSDAPRALDTVLGCVARTPDLLLRGLIGALAAVPSARAQAFLDAAWPRLGEDTASAHTHLVAALRACALRGTPPPKDLLAQCLRHHHPTVRAAACRAGRMQVTSHWRDPDLAVRAEAAIASGPAQPLQAAAVLWQAVAELARLAQSASGWSGMQARRRLARWLSHLAQWAPLGHQDIPTLLEHLAPREALWFALHHGDPAHLGFVRRALAEPAQARWAGFIWQSLSGVDLEANGLTAPEPHVELDAPLARIRQDADQGLPLPNVAAVVAHPANGTLAHQTGNTVLEGQGRTPARLRRLLLLRTNAPQLLRAVAASTWNAQAVGPRIELRSSAAELLRQDRALDQET